MKLMYVGNLFSNNLKKAEPKLFVHLNRTDEE